MALTQKQVKEEIARAEEMIRETVVEKQQLLEEIKKKREDDNKISLEPDLSEDYDSYNGLSATIQYYTGHLNALEWVLKNMKTKKKKENE